MAYMHRKDFSVLSVIEAPEYRKDYTEVDELIAYPVSILNKKGYKTSRCTSGHPFGSIEESKYSKETFGLDQLEAMALEALDAPGDMRRIIMKYDEGDTDTYISFKGNYEFKSLPEGWKPELNELGWTAMRREYEEYFENPFRAFEAIVREAEKLTEWAESLPENK